MHRNQLQVPVHGEKRCGVFFIARLVALENDIKENLCIAEHLLFFVRVRVEFGEIVVILLINGVMLSEQFFVEFPSLV